VIYYDRGHRWTHEASYWHTDAHAPDGRYSRRRNTRSAGGRARRGSRFDDAIKTDDGYIISGTLKPAGETLGGYATKVDDEGDEIWSFLRGGDGVDYLSFVIEEDGYLFAGAKGAPNKHVKGDAWVVKTDDEGNVEWEETYTGESGSAFYTAQALDDGYIAMGSTTRTAVSLSVSTKTAKNLGTARTAS